MKTVLVIEGNGHNPEALQALLEDNGYTVSQARDKALQVSEVDKLQPNIDASSPRAIYRSDFDGKMYAVAQTNNTTLRVSGDSQGASHHLWNIFENAPVGIFRSSLDGKLLSVNPAGARMCKYASPQEMVATVNQLGIGKTLYVHNEHREALLDRVLLSLDWQVCEERFYCKDGSIIDCVFHLRALRGTDGRPVELEGFVEDVSKLKRAERELQFTQFAVDKMGDQAFWVNPNGQFVYVNDAACFTLGYSQQELASMSIFDIDLDCTPAFFTQKWQELKRRNSKTFERQHRSRDGRVYPVELRGNYLVFEGQEYGCFFATDISERKRQEKALHLTQFAIDKTSDQAFWVTQDSRLFYVNDAACRTLGYTREELLQMSVPDIDPTFPVEVFAELWRELKEKGSFSFETWHRAKDGKSYPVEMRANFFVFDGKEYLCAFATDISERNRKDEDQRLTQFVIDKTVDQAFWGTPEGRLLYVNDAACEALGYSREELVGMSISDIDPNFSEERLVGHWQDLKESGSMHFESRHRAKDGRVYPVDIRTNYVNFDGKEYRCSFATDISERKASEEALRQAKLIVENSSVVLFRWREAEGWPVEMVTRNISQFGYTPEELMSGTIPFAELVHPEDLNRVAAEVQAHVDRGEDRFRQEYRIVTKQGDVCWVDDRTVVERDAEGRVSHYQGTVMDITDRKRTEAALRDSEQNYRSIIEHAPFGITHSTKDGKLLSVNPALAGILKYDSAEELLEIVNRSSIQEVLFPEPSQRAHLVERILTGNAWHVFDNRLLCKDGSVVTCRVHSRRILDQAGRESEFESFQENVTDRLAAEQALRETEEKFRVLAETSPVGICIYQGENILYANPAMEQLFGYSADELYRMKFWDWTQDDFKEMVRERGQARLRGEAVPAQYESCYVTKAGEDKYALISAGVIEYQGRPAGVAYFHDITKRKRAEELVKDSLAEKEVLLREIHHRVKNNLQVVSSLLYLQAQKLTDPELQNHFLESQSRICSMALAHEQLYQSKSLADVSLRSYVESLVSQLRQIFQLPGQQIECRTVVEDIVLDIVQVIPCGLLITELLSNAYKHAFVDGRNGTITISMERVGGHFILSVADDGLGLPAALDFRQATTLGLQLVTALVSQLNGSVEVKREDGTLIQVTFAES